MPDTDTRGRRTRTMRQPIGKRITLRERDLLWLLKLHEHGPLPTSYLHAFTRHLGRDKSRALKRLADLFNDGGYLDRPSQQFETIDARFNQIVYQLHRRGEEVLVAEGGFSRYAPRPSGPWVHRFMVSCITASLELAASARPGLRYLPQHAILERAERGLKVNLTYSDPTTGAVQSGKLIPDAICGITRDGTDDRTLLLAIEADRHTEPLRSGTVQRKSVHKNVLQYREYIGRGRYKEHLKTKAPMLVLTVTTSHRHMRGMIDLVTEIAPSGKNSFMCFQAVPEFSRPFKPPLPLPMLLDGPWERAGHHELGRVPIHGDVRFWR